MSKLWRRVLLIGIFSVVLAVIALGVIAWRRTGGAEVRTVRAERHDVAQEVSFSGAIEPAQQATLGFEFAGTIKELFVAVGDTVPAGAVLARLDADIASLELAVARAERASTQATSNIARENAADSAARTEAENATLLERKRQVVRDAKAELDQKRVIHQQEVIEDGDGSSAAEVALASLLAAESAYHAAQQDLAVTERTVAKTNEQAQAAAAEAAAAHQVTLQAAPAVAGLSAVEAAEALASVKLSKRTMTAPFAGVITVKQAEAGEYVAPGTAVLTLADTAALEITAAVPETDVLKFAVGSTAEVTFDALPSSLALPATVTAIAPAAVVIEGVPTYEVTLLLTQGTAVLRSGLTANVTVYGERREGVVAVPRRVVIRRGDTELVRVRGADGAIAERPVVTGLLGSDGLVEVVEGLSAGEEVVVSTGDE